MILIAISLVLGIIAYALHRINFKKDSGYLTVIIVMVSVAAIECGAIGILQVIKMPGFV